MSAESLSSLSSQQNRRLSNPLSDGETGLVIARSRPCFGFVFVQGYLKTEDICMPAWPSTSSFKLFFLSLSSILRSHNIAQSSSVTVAFIDFLMA